MQPHNNTNTLPVGSSSAAPYLAFGDDSHFPNTNTLVFAVVIIPRTRLKQVETRLAVLKEKYKVPAHVPLHCKILFNRHPKEKAGLSHLSPKDVYSIAARAVTIMNQTGVILRYAVADLSVCQSAIGKELELVNKDDVSTTKLPITEIDQDFGKVIIGKLANLCFAVPPDGSHGPTASECEIFLAEDKTKLKFVIGAHGRRADSHYSGFSDIGATDGNVFQLQPTILKAHEAPMLQLADIAAYMCSHMSDTSEKGRFLQEQLARVRYWSRLGFNYPRIC